MNLGSRGLLETLLSTDEMYGDILFLFSPLLQHCSSVKLQKCFADQETSPDFPSARGLGYNYY